MTALRIQIGKTYVRLAWPFDWEYQTIITGPRMYGGGVWIERSYREGA